MDLSLIVAGSVASKGKRTNCMDEQEYDLTVPANRRDLIHVIEAVTPRAETLTYYVVQLGAGQNPKA